MDPTRFAGSNEVLESESPPRHVVSDTCTMADGAYSFGPRSFGAPHTASTTTSLSRTA